MIIYVDPTNGYKVSAAPALGRIAAEDTFFDNKCPNLIESYRYVPAEATWTREDGEVFSGEMIAPHKDIRQYNAIQHQYNQTLLAQYEQALTSIEQAIDYIISIFKLISRNLVLQNVVVR